MSRTPPSRSFLRTGTAQVALGASMLLVAGTLATGSSAAAVPPGVVAESVNLGTAAGFSVLAGPSVANTGAGTVLALDLGVSGTLAGFPPGTVTGTTHIDDEAVETAQADRESAYAAAAAQTGGTAFAGDQAGKTYTPGLYTAAAAITNSGTVTLDADGDPSAIFVFQIGAALSSAASTKVVLADGALANNVYWQVLGAVSLGADAKWVGTLLATGAVSFGEGASLKGRALTPSTVALANSPVTKPIDDLTAPIISVDGGDARSTNDTTPLITGTTDEPAGRTARVAVSGQTLTAPVGPDGTWAVSAVTLPVGAHALVATITDPSGNTGTASQALTVDVAAPVVTITGGGSSATNDTTPTITGTTTEPGDPTVTVTVAGQTLSAPAADGAWSVDAAALTEAAHLLTASVDDAAGNTGAAGQVLDVDITVPVVTIDGGATRSTVDTSPWTYGTTAEQAGTVVHLAIGGQSLTATVAQGGTWGVSATTLPAGTYVVAATVADPANNSGTMSQVLTIGPGVDPGPVDPGPVDPGPGDPGADPRYRPDAEIRQLRGTFVGQGSYDVSEQGVTSTLKRRAKGATFQVRVTNRGDVTERMTVLGTRKSAKFSVTYLDGGRIVTAAVLAGTYQTKALKPGASTTLTVRVTKLKRAKKGSRRTFEIRMASAHDTQKSDTVAASVRTPRG